MVYILNRGLLATLLVLVLFGVVPTTQAQQSTDPCQFMQDQVGFLQNRAAELLVTAANQNAVYESALAALPMDFGTIQSLILEGQNPFSTPAERESYRQAIAAELDLGLTLDRLLNVIEQIEAFDGAAFIICSTADPATGTAPADGSVIENTLPQGGDEIIVQLGQYNGQINIPRPATDTETDGWYLQVDGTVTATELESGKVEEHRSLVAFMLGDDGTFLNATLFFWAHCDVSGSMTITGDQFNMVFSGIHDGTTAIIEIQAQGQFLGTTLDENLRVPATATATFRRVREDGSISHEGFFTPGGGVAHLERRGTSQYRTSFCGDGIF